MLGQATNGRRVGAAVVVDDDDHRCLAVTDVVQCLVGHATGQCAIAHHHDHLTVVALPAQCLRHAGGVAQPSGGVAILDEIVLAFGSVGIATHSAQLAQPGKAFPRASQQLVDVGLVTGVPENPVAGAVKDAVQGQR